MNEELEFIRFKLGKRHWVIGIISSQDIAIDLLEFRALHNDEPDMFLIPNADTALQERWSEIIQTRYPEDWTVQMFMNVDIPHISQSHAEPYLIIGPRHLLRRFYVLINEGKQQLGSSEEELGVRLGPYPKFPNLSDVPIFREEEDNDPFGQNPLLLNRGLLDIAHALAHLIEKAHSHDIAITLPESSFNTIEPQLKPWRTTVPLEKTPYIMSVDELTDVLLHTSSSTLEEGDAINLAQRCLLALTSLYPDSVTPIDWHGTAKMLEDIGYVLISQSTSIEDYLEDDSSLRGFFEIGALVANIHTHKKVILGDIHLENFFYNKELPSGMRAAAVDPDRIRMLNRPLTIEERARDLALLKLQCNFMDWQAVKCGYQLKNPEIAKQVFQLI